MSVITRFAPSSTGFLHLGGARTALFNYLFAKHHKGKFLLRIEDTDQERSTKESIDSIFDSLEWLNLNPDGTVIFQSKRNAIYKEAAFQLLKNDKAYYCFTSQAEINRQRNEAVTHKKHFIFKSPWRDANPSNYPSNIKPVIRLKAPREGYTIINDMLQGEVIIENSHLDDMILLRSNGTATYMLAVVVDDYYMGITHIIRGDDHLTNTARQILLYQAFNYIIPSMIHIPLIYNRDGTKLSKRHGALSVQVYQNMGYLPEALCNYLLRLGWSHKDDEIISREQSIEWFDLDGLGKSPARFDFIKMNNINAHYLRHLDNHVLTTMVGNILEKDYEINLAELNYIEQAMDSLKVRSETLVELSNLAKIYLVNYPINYSDEVKMIITNCNKDLVDQVIKELNNLEHFNTSAIQVKFKEIAQKHHMKLGELVQPIRALITGMTSSPSIFEIIAILGRLNITNRLKNTI